MQIKIWCSAFNSISDIILQYYNIYNYYNMLQFLLQTKLFLRISKDLSLRIYMYIQWHNHKIFRTGEVFWNKITSIGISSAAHQIKALKKVSFSKIPLKQHYKWEIWPIDEQNQGIFFSQNQGTFFHLSYMGRRDLPLYLR